MGPLLHFAHYTAQRDRFLQCPVIVCEMWVNHTPETTRASITVPDISPSRQIQRNAFSKEDHGNCLMVPYNYASCRFSCPAHHCNYLLLLCYASEVMASLGCCTKMSLFCVITLGPILPTGLVTGYNAESLWTTLPTVLISCPPISISLDP